MKKNISSCDCESLFDDKFHTLSMKDIGIELKHFSIGTAPEKPSFLVNQDDLKKKMVEKFCNFFDKDRSQGLEVIFLKSNYGNGKSHFIRMIYTFLNEYENVIAKKVSLRQEETDLKKKILESISQKKMKECADFLVNAARKEAVSDEKDAVIYAVSEKYTINMKLSQVLYEAVRSNDLTKQVQAIAILKGNYLPSHLKNFDCNSKDLSGEFYYNVIKLISRYLQETDQYLVVVFDEYEHVFSWKNETARKNLYEDIKLFTENISAFGNLFFVFAESISADNQTESMDDPAFVSRKANLTYQIADISSENEVDKLLKMILKRYEKYYSVSFEGFTEAILSAVSEEPSVKTKTNYRAYIQAIMKVLDRYRDEPPTNKKSKTHTSIENHEVSEPWLTKWRVASSISRKTMLCQLLENLLNQVGETIIEKSKKRGEYITKSGDICKRYHVISTDNPGLKDLERRYKIIQKEGNEKDVLYILYPAIEDKMDIESGAKLVYYDEMTICKILKKIQGDKEKIHHIDFYMEILNRGNDDAKETGSFE